MVAHVHAPVHGCTKIRPFIGCVSRERENRAAHNGVALYELCMCGAMRVVNVSVREREEGSWDLPESVADKDPLGDMTPASARALCAILMRSTLGCRAREWVQKSGVVRLAAHEDFAESVHAVRVLWGAFCALREHLLSLRMGPDSRMYGEICHEAR